MLTTPVAWRQSQTRCTRRWCSC